MRLFAPLKESSFRFLVYGRLMICIGNAFRFVAVPWLVYRITDSPVMLGLTFFTRQLTAFLFTPIAGVWADKMNPKTLFLAAHIIIAFVDFLVGGLTVSGNISVYMLILAQFFVGLFAAFEMPVRQIMIQDNLKDKSQLVSGIALNGAIFQTSRIIFPAIAGMTINYLGSEGYCLIINGFLTILAFIFYYKTNKFKTPIKEKKKTLEELKIGFEYATKSPPILSVIILTSVLTLLALSINVLFPILSKDVFLGDAKDMGTLVSALGVGGIIGSFLIGNRKHIGKLDRDIVVGAFLVSVAVTFLGISSNYYLSLLCLVLIGLGKSAVFSSANTIIQSISVKQFRSRVLGLYITSFMGAMMIGSVLMGWGADTFGVKITLMTGGMICFGLLFYLVKERKGLKLKGIKMYKLASEPI